MRLINEFSWSFSRANTFTECQKKYWYTYYGSWEGWPKTPRDERPSIDPLAAKLYMLKQIQHLPMFIGSCVHTTIEEFLKKSRHTKKAISPELLIEAGEKLFDKGLVDSKKGVWKAAPKKHANLFEHYYGSTDISEEAITAAKAKITTSLSNWVSSPIVQQLAFSPNSEWLSIEELNSFQLQGRFKIIVVIDFALKWKSGVACLFDWKTGGESDKTLTQLYCYALFANRTWGIPLDRIVISPFYLFQNSYSKIGFQQEEPLSVEKLEQVEAEMLKSCEEMAVLHSTDPCPDPRLFAYTKDRGKCERCPFKEVCIGAEYQDLSRQELALVGKC
ncbi:MAG: PD-(D/E)XK nuclease family protein [Verrucomicrobia bacterium]|nr:PD-(D/E)XK nuclease family protein [Verrucomicrobiota bacterium]